MKYDPLKASLSFSPFAPSGVLFRGPSHLPRRGGAPQLWNLVPVKEPLTNLIGDACLSASQGERLKAQGTSRWWTWKRSANPALRLAGASRGSLWVRLRQ